MKTFTKEELAKVLELHKMWLNGVKGGERANLSYANLSGAYLINADLSKANLYKADLYSANLSNANLYKADLSNANLSNANLSSANLSSAHLYNANLSSADLRYANLSDANLSDANLSSANLQFTDVFCFTIGKHYAFFHTGDKYEEGSYLKIGCRGFSLKYWLDNYKKIGKKEDYSKEEIKRYGIQIKAIMEMTRDK